MVKLGKYQLPFKSLDDCIKYLAMAHEKLQDFSIKRDRFADAIHLKPTGGGYGLIIGSFPMYGLAETGDGYIRYTDLAQKILYGRETEKEELKARAVRNVILFSDIYDRYGDSPTDEQLRLFLRDKADVEISKESRIASEVGKLFKKNVSYLKMYGGEPKGMTQQPSSGNVAFSVTAPNIRIDVDSPLKITLVEAMIADAKQRFRVVKSNETDVDDSNSTEGREED